MGALNREYVLKYLYVKMTIRQNDETPLTAARHSILNTRELKRVEAA